MSKDQEKKNFNSDEHFHQRSQDTVTSINFAFSFPTTIITNTTIANAISNTTTTTTTHNCLKTVTCYVRT